MKRAIGILMLAAARVALAQTRPPAAPVRPVIDDYFGAKVRRGTVDEAASSAV